LEPGPTFQQYVVQDKYYREEEDEFEGIEKHPMLLSLRCNQSFFQQTSMIAFL
jgi:hypothetical protein